MVCTLAGCGTLYNNEIVPCPKTHADMFRFYGGVRKDLEEVASIGSSNENSPATVAGNVGLVAVGTAFLAADLPLSALGDTVLLPYTFWHKMETNNSSPTSDIGNIER